MLASTPSPTLHADIISFSASPTFHSPTHSLSHRFQNQRSPRQSFASSLAPALPRKSPHAPASASTLAPSRVAAPTERPAAAAKATVDVGTQYSPPPQPTPHPADRSSPPDKRQGMPISLEPPPEPVLEPQLVVKRAGATPPIPHSATSSSVTLAQPSSAPATSTYRSSPKGSRQSTGAVIFMPEQYETCDVKELVLLISNMLMELIRFNDEIPLKDGRLTRFHSRAPPGISVRDYLQRLATHATLSPPILLSMVYYIDRLCALYPAFTISSLTVHRFLITSATVASKGLSDSFWTNNTYARVGGVSLKELALLELEFLWRVEWRIVPKPEVLVDYYRSLVERSEGYEIESKEADDDMISTDNPA